ncbi:hypothetical protein VL10_23760 [Leclercia adecarboxylata]|nr:hypothetical protein VL10_23760 [Leclercia adecarboxylata]KMN61125.1 hypothetical protein VK95_23505 [Leclercia sp. LK8]
MMKTNIAAEQKRIEREYTRLCEYYSSFTKLKLAMPEFAARAKTDPDVAKKLNDLQALMPQGIAGLEQQARKDMQSLNVALKQLQSRLENIVNNQ